jgi:hypothetical protein
MLEANDSRGDCTVPVSSVYHITRGSRTLSRLATILQRITMQDPRTGVNLYEISPLGNGEPTPLRHVSLEDVPDALDCGYGFSLSDKCHGQVNRSFKASPRPVVEHPLLVSKHA